MGLGGVWGLQFFLFSIVAGYAPARASCPDDLARPSRAAVEKVFHRKPEWRSFYQMDAYASDEIHRVLVLGSRPSLLERHDRDRIESSRRLFEIATLADRIHLAFPEKDVISADLSVRDTLALDEHYRRIKIDHRAIFPIESDQLDAIVAKRVLCLCRNAAATCGGVKTKLKSAVQFFSEVARVLNKRNPAAFAILHGRPWHDHDISETVWLKAAHEVVRRYPVRAILHYDALSGERPPTFISIEFRPRVACSSRRKCSNGHRPDF